MLASLMTALFFVVRVFGKLGSSLFREEQAPYLMYQPLPWHVQYVTQNRRASREQEIISKKLIPGTPTNQLFEKTSALSIERRGSCQYTCTTYPARGHLPIGMLGVLFSLVRTPESRIQGLRSSRRDISTQDATERAALTIQSHYRKYQQHKHQQV